MCIYLSTFILKHLGAPGVSLAHGKCSFIQHWHPVGANTVSLMQYIVLLQSPAAELSALVFYWGRHSEHLGKCSSTTASCCCSSPSIANPLGWTQRACMLAYSLSGTLRVVTLMSTESSWAPIPLILYGCCLCHRVFSLPLLPPLTHLALTRTETPPRPDLYHTPLAPAPAPPSPAISLQHIWNKGDNLWFGVKGLSFGWGWWGTCPYYTASWNTGTSGEPTPPSSLPPPLV